MTRSNRKIARPLPGPLKALPKEVTALALLPSSPNLVVAASEDRILRVIDLTTSRPLCCVVGLPSEVSSLVFEHVEGAFSDGSWGKLWLACGPNAHLVELVATPFLRPFASAVLQTLTLSSSAEDEVNSLALSADGLSLAWCGDDGKLGTVNLKTGLKTWMKGKHSSLAGSVAFVPGRSDIVSTGYDSTARLWASTSGSLLDTTTLAAPPSDSPSMAPAFPSSLATYLDTRTQEAYVVLGCADGSIWLSTPDLPPPGESDKDRRKRLKGRWKGLQGDRLRRGEVALGPVVGVAFVERDDSSAGSPVDILTVSHLGNIKLYRILSRSTLPAPSSDGSAVPLELETLASWATSTLKKCTALVVHDSRIVIGGLGEQGQGRMEAWDLR